MYNPILFVINSNGDVVKKSGIVRAINGYREYAVVITPLSSTAVSMSTMTDNGAFDKKEQYVLPTNLKVSDFVSSDDPLYQSIYDWNVYGVEIKEIALESIALFRTGSTTVTFQFQRIKASDKCVAYKGYFGVDLPLPQTAEIGDYYECQDYNYTIVSGTHNYTFTKGMYVYFNGVRWVKDRLLVELNVPTVEIAVEPSHATGYQLDDDDVNYLLPLGDNIVEALQKAELALQKIEDIKSGLEPLDELSLKDEQGNEMNITFDGQDPIINYRGVSAELFKNLFLEVEPAVGVTFANGMQVMYAGSIGGSGKRLAKPTNLAELKENPNLYLGAITQITEDNHGIVNWYGVVNDINTYGQTLGAPVYVGNNGSWTTVKPISPLPIITVGLIERVNSSQGQISVRPNVGNYLNQLHDVYTNGHTFVGGETIMFNLANGRYEVYDLKGNIFRIDTEINNIKNGTTIVKKAEQDKNGNDVVNTYETKADATNKLATKVDKTQKIIGIDLQDDILLTEFKTALGNATQSVAGLLSAEDKTHLDGLVALLESSDGNSVVDTIGEILAIFNNYPEGADLVTALNGKVDKVAGKGLSQNDFTDALKNKLDGLLNGNQYYDKTYIDALKDKNGWQSELLGTLANNGTIALSVINEYDEIQMYAKDTLGVIDNENIRPSLMQSGDSVYFFDDTQAFIMVDTVFGFYAPVGYTLQVVGIKYTDLKAIDTTYDNTASGMTATNVQGAIDELDTQVELKENLANKAIDFSTVNDTKYPTTKAVSERLLNLPIAELNNKTLREVFDSIVVNPTFDNGDTNWLLTGTGSVSNGIYNFVATSQYGNIRQAAPLSYQNDKLYVVSRFKTSSNQVLLLSRGNTTSTSFNQIAHSGSNNFEIKSMNWINTTNELARFSVVDNRASGWSNIEVDYVYVANQTSLGISSLSQAQMDYWFNVYQTLKTSETNAIFSMFAPKQQEAWITPTLTGSTSTYIRYRKDTLGTVIVEGNITVTTAGTNLTLPVGYRPLFAYTVGNLTFNTDGTVVSSATGNESISVRFTGGQ